MTYLVLARKWRPRKFAEMVGQEHVVRALTNALTSGRVHHAFLFTGTRGVGKTTVARIFAKSLNCETGVGADPCGTCSACREIDEGRFVDLIEVDAASRTKVEDTRELLENVQYAPARGRYKVYLVDEVHMLSVNSFNALLKTLEEPPPHVKFLLATTDPQKLPITVVSRCLQFHLKRLPPGLIAERMRRILEAEGVAFDAPSLPLLARAADGSLRDGLSLLDQVLVFGGGRVGEADVRAMLGTIDRNHVVHLVEALAAADAPGLLAIARALDDHAPDYDQVLVQLASLLERVALQQVVPQDSADAEWAPEVLDALARAVPPADLQLYYQIALNGRRDLELAPEPRVGFEMTLLRMLAFRPADTVAGAGATAAVAPAGGTRGAANAGTAAASPPAPRSPARPAAPEPAAERPAVSAPGPSTTGPALASASQEPRGAWA
ncbi:MAG: DNA polymerase III subunit gamma/tau, partial [Pseudomonadota bacterium]